MSKTELIYMFERFYRSNRKRAKGSKESGIGLSIVKQLVEKNNGSITAKSELEQKKLLYAFHFNTQN